MACEFCEPIDPSDFLEPFQCAPLVLRPGLDCCINADPDEPEITWRSMSGAGAAHISYCPMCGRDLTEVDE